MFLLTDYDYELPEELIAQTPLSTRDSSRLMVVNRRSQTLSHYRFQDLADFLYPGDVLVLNNTRVIPGRLFGRKASGGKIEVLILNYAEAVSRRQAGKSVECRCLIRASKGPKVGMRLNFEAELEAEVIDRSEGTYLLRFFCDNAFETILDRIGKIPLPPYIKREEAPDGSDRKTYQTVYAKHKGAIAAPTAGLHFTANLLETLRRQGVRIATITLHVGYGTFLPVRVDDIRTHRMHAETYTITPDTVDIINRAKAEGHRVIAVGTTSVRTLEYAADESGTLTSGSAACDLYIYPGYRFKVVDALITNFHLPKSTLLMLVSAFAGRETILDAYAQAIKNRYRFFSYGDAMLIHNAA